MKNKLYLLLGIALISLLLFLGNWGLTESSEARYATIGKEMFQSNDYVNPTLLGIKHLHKPPVTYYITSFAYHLFGVNEFGARFFMQIALLFQILLVFKITLLLYKNEKMALAAAVIYYSIPITLIAVRTLTTDAYLTTCILASIYFWLQHHKTTKSYYLYLFYLFLGFIFEIKGPVGFIVPLSFVISYKICFKDRIKTNIHQFLGFLLFVLVAGSWYIFAIIENPGLMDYFLNDQLVERVSKNKFKRGKPVWYYLLIMPAVGLPWLFYLLFYLKKNLKKIVAHKKEDFVLLCTFSILFIVLMVSTSKLVLYVLPLYFILAIFSAKLLNESSLKNLKLFSTVYIVLIISFSGALALIPFLPIDLNLTITSVYAIPIFIVSSILALLVNKRIDQSNYLKPGYLGLVFISMILASSLYVFKQNELKINSAKPLADFIAETSDSNRNVLIYNRLLPSLSFYLDSKITTVNHGYYTTQREVKFEATPHWKTHLIHYNKIEDRERLFNYTSDQPIYLIKRKKDILPDTLLLLKNKLKNKKDFDKFEIYY